MWRCSSEERFESADIIYLRYFGVAFQPSRLYMVHTMPFHGRAYAHNSYRHNRAVWITDCVNFPSHAPFNAHQLQLSYMDFLGRS